MRGICLWARHPAVAVTAHSPRLSDSRRRAFALLFVLVASVAVSACAGSGPSTKDSEESKSESSRLSLEEYAELCGDYAGDEIPEGATSGEVSEELKRSIELLESINPPREVADYHNETLSFARNMKRLLDVQPEDESPNLLAFLVLAPQMQALEDSMTNLDPEVRRKLAAVGCAEDVESVAEGDGPSTVTFAVEENTNRVDWTIVTGAEFYKVYHGGIKDCYVDRGGAPSSCEELASSVAGTTYVHKDPHRDLNFYWVSACDGWGVLVHPQREFGVV